MLDMTAPCSRFLKAIRRCWPLETICRIFSIAERPNKNRILVILVGIRKQRFVPYVWGWGFVFYGRGNQAFLLSYSIFDAFRDDSKI